jgi:hypothetical protein
MMHHILASHFGLTHQQVMDLHGRGYSYEDIATAANIAVRSGRPLADVTALRDQRMEWPAIASQLGVATADVQRPFYRYSGPEAVMYDVDFYRVYTGIPAADYERYRKMGYTPREIGMIYNVVRRTGRQPDEVVQMLDRGMTWEAIARENRLAMADIQTPEARVAGARSTMGSDSMMSGRMDYSKPNMNIDWSRRFALTPLEMKRLRAMGLKDREVFVVANAARLSGRPVDALAQRIFRGQTTEQIAMDLNVSVSALEEVQPMWKTPEWEQAVQEGRYFMPSMTAMQSGTMREGTR